ncbi:hypothetical protein LS77_011335 [Helicobacter bilis]|uniref:Uncharacterized protein n=2 Tax=Helicobacter bilis TaxID=37372 RepID=A0A6D2C3C7_9HELI|nr:hypothetical protein [Helicobacter bilis]EMZ36923.1 hypothetical protein C826_02306 [Helicobacter bilis WiWa]TLE01855.1 hypothetical protein LS77_011335 [Helicobacter bilis]
MLWQNKASKAIHKQEMIETIKQVDKNSVGRSIASGVASAMGMSGMAQRIAGQTGRDRQGYQERMLQAMQNGGFTATPTPHVEPKNVKNYKA